MRSMGKEGMIWGRREEGEEWGKSMREQVMEKKRQRVEVKEGKGG